MNSSKIFVSFYQFLAQNQAFSSILKMFVFKNFISQSKISIGACDTPQRKQQ